ncbi:MAG: DUF2029 domain-containing protein [Planctomycetota bacterium]|nr:MAG: DUF2029 domain-containing protein [Planctomycetota bacterium]
MLIDRWMTKEPQWLAAMAILLLGTAFLITQTLTDRGGHSQLGPPLGGDFSGFYAAGRAAQAHGLMAPYDLAIQNDHYHAAFPAIASTSRFPYIYPPFLTAVFRPLSRLPYRTAALLWIGMLIALTAIGFVILSRLAGDLSGGDWLRVCGLILAFEPLLFESILGGQLSPIAFSVMAGIVLTESRQQSFRSGLLLSLLCYKPTLLIVILPMWGIGRRWSSLAGFTWGALIVGLLTVSLVGFGGTIEYAERLLDFARLTRSAGLELRTWKYVDITAFWRLMLGKTELAQWLSLLFGGGGALFLARQWARSARSSLPPRLPLWAATCVATLILNVYVATYDVILAIPAILGVWLTQRSRVESNAPAPGNLDRMLAVMWISPWLAASLSQSTGLQLLTPALGGLAVYLAQIPAPQSNKNTASQIDV